MTTLARTAAAAALLLSAAGSASAQITVYALGTSGGLYRFDASNPAATTFVGGISSGLGANEKVLGIDFRPSTGVLYGLTNANRIITINTSTAAPSPVGGAFSPTLNPSGSWSIDFNPNADRLRAINSGGDNRRFNPNDGSAVATDTNLAYKAGDPNFGNAPFCIGTAYTNNFGGAPSTVMYNIDARNGILVQQGNPSPNDGQLTTIGPLGVTFANANIGFDIYTGAGGVNTAYASLIPATGGQARFYTLSLASGAATLVGTIGTTEQIMDIAVIPTPGAAGLFGLLGLAAVRPRRR
ncbi:MAG: DUF4394 domain-containing protein [Phycisphaerales bacterium]|nr:DUF4394 domain-containing protein [Phycisphaerales bacterium]